MSSSVIIHHQQLGPVCYKFSIRAKTIVIRMSPSKGILVTVPIKNKVSNLALAQKFVEQNKDRVHAKMKDLNNTNPKTIFVESTKYITHFHQLKLESSGKIGGGLSISIDEKYTRVIYPIDINWKENWVQQGICKAIEETYRKEAKIFLPPIVKQWSVLHNFNFSSISIRKTKSQWGSCSNLNNLSFSLYVMSLPLHLIDYIILHELCHTVHHNHSEDFHKLLKKICPAKEEMEKELKRKRMII